MEMSKKRPRSILKSSLSPKPDNSRKVIRFSPRNEVIPIPRAGLPDEVALKTSDLVECLDNTLRKLEKTLDELRSVDGRGEFLKAVQLHSQRLGLGSLQSISERATSLLVDFLHAINEVKQQLFVKDKDFLFTDDFSSFEESFRLSPDQSNKVFRVVLENLYLKVSRHNQIGRVYNLGKSDLGFSLITYAHGVKMQDRGWPTQRLVNSMICNDLSMFKRELGAKADVEWQLEPDDTFFSLILGAVQFKRHAFLQYTLDRLPLADMSVQLVKELLYAGLKDRKHQAIWRKVFQHQFAFIETKGGLVPGDFDSWVPAGEHHVTISTSGKGVIQQGQVTVKLFREGQNILVEFSSSSGPKPLECSLFIKKEEAKTRLYRKNSEDEFEEIPGLEEVYNYERGFQLVQKSDSVDEVLLKQLTCLAAKEDFSKKIQVATNFFGLKSSKVLASVKSVKHRVKYTSSFYDGCFSSQSCLWEPVSRPDELMAKVNSLKASPFVLVDNFRCTAEDTLEDRYIGIAERVFDVSATKTEILNYQENLQLRGLRNVELCPSVWVAESTQGVSASLPWSSYRGLLCLASLICPELIGVARISCGIKEAFSPENLITNMKLKVDRDDRTEIKLESHSANLTKSLTAPAIKLVDLQNTLPVSTMESKALIAIPKFKWRILKPNDDNESCDVNESSSNSKAQSVSVQGLNGGLSAVQTSSEYTAQIDEWTPNESPNRPTNPTRPSNYSSLTTIVVAGSTDSPEKHKLRSRAYDSDSMKNKFMEGR